jgi:hypothetical protein
VAAMRPLVVADVFPVIYDRLRLDHRVERLDREHLVADPEAERLHERVLPRGARLDEAALGPAEAAPVAQGVAVISGPLSIRTSSEPAPRSRTIWSSARVVWSASIERATRIASASRVYSSTTWSSFSVRPSLVVSNWKSKAQIWLGRSARTRLAGTVDSPSRCRLRFRCRTVQPWAYNSALNFNGGTVTAAASWPRRASGDRSKNTANRTAVARRAPSRALSQSR